MTGVRAVLQPEGREFPNWQLDGERMLGNDFFSKPYLMIKTGEVVLAALSLGYHRPRQYKNLDITEEDDSLKAIASPSFWVVVMFWVCIAIYLNFYLSGN